MKAGEVCLQRFEERLSRMTRVTSMVGTGTFVGIGSQVGRILVNMNVNSVSLNYKLQSKSLGTSHGLLWAFIHSMPTPHLAALSIIVVCRGNVQPSATLYNIQQWNALYILQLCQNIPFSILLVIFFCIAFISCNFFKSRQIII